LSIKKKIIMKKKRVLLVDAYNMLYRSRCGWKDGENPIVYTFFRCLRSVLNQFSPDVAYFVLEGYPEMKMNFDSSYKAQRKREHDPEWFRQKQICINAVSDLTPVISVKHEKREADDVIAHLALNDHAEDECIVISSDKDFILLAQRHESLKLYNPISKKMQEIPDFDYLTYKSLRGDPSDNIPGFRGIGDKRATAMSEDAELFSSFMSDIEKEKLFEKNKQMIEFVKINSSSELDFLGAPNNPSLLRELFNDLGFESLSTEGSWEKYSAPFYKLIC